MIWLTSLLRQLVVREMRAGAAEDGGRQRRNYVLLRRFFFPFPIFYLKLDLVAIILFYYALGIFCL